MARIRKIEISNFRAIWWLSWFPSDGINCLIGPGDSGKSTILEAIDLCLGARRSLTFCDDDFHRLQLTQPIKITITLGELDSHLRSMETYGLYLRGFNRDTGAIETEPGTGLDTVLTIELSVRDDLAGCGKRRRSGRHRPDFKGPGHGSRSFSGESRRDLPCGRSWRCERRG